jgi:hypothetical protein
MMKMESASASVEYGRISPYATLRRSRLRWISQIAISAVTRVGKKSDATRNATTIALPGVRTWTSA